MIEPSYIHQNASEILAETQNILCASAKGKALWDANKANIIILKGPMPQAFVYQDDLIYLRIPALQNKGRVEQAIDLAGAFIELKINAQNPPPTENLESDEILVAQHYKNVEIMMKAFEVADELEDSGYSAVKELRLMGVGKIYQAWKTGADLEKCANIYWDMFDTSNSDNKEE